MEKKSNSYLGKKKGGGIIVVFPTDARTQERMRWQRQDEVDNAVFALIMDLAPAGSQIEWDICMIGEVRDVVQKWVCRELKLMTDNEFYP